VACCERLGNFPHRGTARGDIRPGLRVTNYKGRTMIAFGVGDDALRVSILGVYYGGQNYEAALDLEPDAE
jgi:toxin ParE1/3/4